MLPSRSCVSGLLFLTSFLAGSLSAQTDIVSDGVFIPTHQTTQLDLGFHGLKRTVAPVPPVSAIFVPEGSSLVLRVAPELGTISDVKWFHNGDPIATGTTEVSINKTAKSDSGFYWATFSGNNDVPSTSSQQIIVSTPDHHRLANMSVRAHISPQAPSVTFGFVVTQQSENKKGYGLFLVRAIGPSLAQFNQPNPLADPEVKFFNAAGEQIEFSDIMIWDAARYYPWLTEVTAQVGAFPIELPSAREPIRLISLPVGAITAQVSSASGGSGDVLFELYEVVSPPPYPEPAGIETPVPNWPGL